MSKSYTPSAIRRSLQYWFDQYALKAERKGNPPADAFLRKLSQDELIAFLNDGTDFDNVKWFVGHKKEYRQAFNEAFMRRYQLNHVDSIPAVNAMLKLKNNPTYASYENLLRYAHESDRAQLQARLEAKYADTPATPETAQIAPSMVRSAFHVKLDHHMGRAALVLNHLSPDWCEIEAYRLWTIVIHIDTWRDGQAAKNHVTIAELRAYLKAAGIYTRQSFNRWKTDALTAGYFRSVTKDRIYYAGKKAVAEMLMTCLPDDVLPDFMGNQAMGIREVWVDIRGNIARFKGQLMGAWLAQRERDETGVTISNAAIAAMWYVSIRTVQHWRIQAQIPAVRNRDNHYKPMANSYHAPVDTREHNHTGQSRHIRQIVNREMTLRGFSPDSFADVGEAKQQKRYFTNRRISAKQAMNKYAEKYGIRGKLYAHMGYEQNPTNHTAYGVWERAA